MREVQWARHSLLRIPYMAVERSSSLRVRLASLANRLWQNGARSGEDTKRDHGLTDKAIA